LADAGRRDGGNSCAAAGESIMRKRDADLRDELKSHLDMAIATPGARGESPQDAVAAARRQFGNLSQVQEATRDVWGRRWLDHLVQDVAHAPRGLRSNPGLAPARFPPP